MFTFGVRFVASVIIRAIQPLTEGETANLKQRIDTCNNSLQALKIEEDWKLLPRMKRHLASEVRWVRHFPQIH